MHEALRGGAPLSVRSLLVASSVYLVGCDGRPTPSLFTTSTRWFGSPPHPQMSCLRPLLRVGDISNGYNEVAQERVLHSIRESEKLDDTIVFSHALLLHKTYISMCNDNLLITAPFLCVEDVQQEQLRAGGSSQLHATKHSKT